MKEQGPGRAGVPLGSSGKVDSTWSGVEQDLGRDP